LHSSAQVTGWRKITDAVHREGGTIFAQLWHVGRVSHPDFYNGALPVAPSALEVAGEAFTQNGKVKIVTPRALEVVEAVVSVWGSQSVGYKLSPYFGGYSMSDSNPPETFSYLAEQLSSLRIGYLHVGEAIAGPMAAPAGTPRLTPMLRDKFSGAVIVNGGYDAHSGHAVIARGEADLVAFGVPFLANPDLPARYRKNASLNPPDQATFYAGEEKGYIDYPTLVGAQEASSCAMMSIRAKPAFCWRR
jgi:2,4-dienoyl-CoA reductase-like NADH-dependent reductase (Old Yellow Enzyme family)